MSQFVLTCCSTADMPKSYFEKRKIPFVCFHFNMDNKTYPDDIGESMSFDTFYQKIRDGAMPTTSQVNVDQFLKFFEPILKEGNDILHISLSSGLSGSSNSARNAKEELSGRYPDRKIMIVDSLGASSGYGLLVDTVADMRDSGISIEKAYFFAQENKLNIHHWFFSTDLTHYRRGGRISGFSAFFGGILGICPLMNMDEGGHLIPREKIRGRQNVIKAIVKKMEEHADGGLKYSGKCFISNSSCYNDAKETANLIEHKFKNLNGKVMINSVGTVIGSHTGPGTVALFFFGDKREKTVG
ncbi:MAG: DegV family protein [Oscillospiraceae bacterium]